MNFQQQQQQHQHVAQQSRREKLRIPGSLHPSSPQSGNHSDHSAGSASAVLEARQGGADQENYSGTTSVRYSGQPAMNDVLPPVYNQNVISADAYNFPAGSELLAYTSAKANGFLGAAASDMLQPQTPLTASFSNQAAVLSKNWTTNGQLGHFSGSNNPLSIAAGGTNLQGSPLHGGSTSASNAVAATLLSSLQHQQQQQQQHQTLGRDGGPMSSYLSGQNAEAMQLFLSGYSGYSDPSAPGNMVLISPSSGSSNSHLAASGAPGGHQQQQQQQQQHFIGIPLTPSSLAQQDTPAVSGLGSSAFASRGNSTYNNWRNGGDEFLFLPSSEATQQRKAMSNEAGGGLNQLADISEYALRQPSLSSMLGQQQSLLQAGHRLEIDNSHQAAAGPGYQSLSLSLSNQNAQLHALEPGINSPGSQDGKRAGQAKLSGDLSHFRSSPRDSLAGASYASLSNSASNKSMYFEAGPSAVSNSFSFVSGSRYLRAAQQLLDEVCSVGRGLKPPSKNRGSQGVGGQSSPAAVTSSVHKEGAVTETSVKSEITIGSSAGASPGTGPAATTVSTTVPPSTTTTTTTSESKENVAVLTPEERQEYEGKKAKLLAMLQEVDRRYRQYYDQMQVVITSFDAVAGAGAATPYTALALQAMSRYFRCLRDAITNQIQSTCKALGEEDVTKSITSRPLTSRLRFIDQQIRQQRAYQQYGMLQQHAWRPQRGLPERSVSILRAWLFEHFLHPYPKDADKMMLARQTGLTRGQVSNWFINARVRLWKPMVEEMYQEEIKEQELGVASAKLLAVDPDDKHNQNGMAESMMNDTRNDRQEQLLVVDKMQLDHGSSEHQSYSSEYGMMMRKADSQMFGEAQAQLKKTRLGGSSIHDSVGGLLAETGGMDVDMKSDGGEAMCVPGASASSLDRHYVHDHYGNVQQNGPMHHHHHQHHHHPNPHPHHHQDEFETRSFGGGRYGGGFGSQYQGNSGVSLTLGLRNCDNLQQLAAAGQQSFLAAGQNFLAGGGGRSSSHHHHIPHHHDSNELCNIYENAAAVAAAGGLNAATTHIGDHESIDYQGRKQQHIESHLLHDFVA